MRDDLTLIVVTLATVACTSSSSEDMDASAGATESGTGGTSPSTVGTTGTNGTSATPPNETDGAGSTSDDTTQPSDASGPSDTTENPPGEGGGFITYMLGDGIYRIEASDGATPVNVSSELDALSPGSDENPAVSRNGAYLTITTTRFAEECEGWSCLAVVEGDLSAGELVYQDGNLLHPDSRAAISNDGEIIVYPGGDGPHAEDLYAIRRSGSGWGASVLLTADSDHEYNSLPVMSGDATTVLFGCGPTPYGQEGTGICEVGIDGAGLAQLVQPAQQGGTEDSVVRHADYTPAGGIVFEADWMGGEQIYLQAPGGTAAVIETDHSNDNSPCSLPGGYVASLWLERPGSRGLHELKIMAPDGSEFSVLTPDVDVLDVGMSCHE